MNKIFLEVVIGNKFDDDAIKILKQKKNLRLIDSSNFFFNEFDILNSRNETLLFQEYDKKKFIKKDFKIVSKRKPNKNQLNDLIFAFFMTIYRVCQKLYGVGKPKKVCFSLIMSLDEKS